MKILNIKLTFLTFVFFIGCSQDVSKNSINTTKISKGTLTQRVTISGNIAPFRKALIMPSYNGYVKKIYARLGDSVKEGDPIVTVSSSLTNLEQAFPLRAPFAGQIVSLNKAEGEYVKQYDSDSAIARIDDLSKIYINALLPELDRNKVKVGMEAIVKTNAVLDKTYKAKVMEINFSSKEQDRWNRSSVVEFPIRFEVLDQDEKLIPGITCLIDIITAKKENVLILRHEYINKNNDEYFVTLANGKRKTVKLGMQNEEVSEVVEGLEEGDVVEKVDFSKLYEAGTN